MANAAENLVSKHDIFAGTNVDTSLLRSQLAAKDSEVARLHAQVRELERLASIGREEQVRQEQHARWSAEYRSQREAALIHEMSPEVLDLFEREPIQRGADGIAKKLKRNTEHVRLVVRALVSCGKLVATGTTRNRSYSRPFHIERESITPESTSSANDSRPSQSGRKRVA